MNIHLILHSTTSAQSRNKDKTAASLSKQKDQTKEKRMSRLLQDSNLRGHGPMDF
jgi:hypothetical protein